MPHSSIDVDEVIEKRENLYTAYEEKSANLGRNCIFQRIVIISRIRNTLNDASAIGTKYEEFINETAQKLQIDVPTGFLMIQKKHAVHIVEAPMKMIMLYMREVLNDSETHGSNFDHSKVLVIAHDILISHYQIFHWQEIEIEVVDTDFKPGENDEKLVIDILKQVNDIGIYIMKTPKHYIKSEYASMFVKNTQLLPSQGVISYLLKDDVDCISTLHCLLQQYDSIYDTENPTDHTWPLPIRQYPYNVLF